MTSTAKTSKKATVVLPSVFKTNATVASIYKANKVLQTQRTQQLKNLSGLGPDFSVKNSEEHLSPGMTVAQSKAFVSNAVMKHEYVLTDVWVGKTDYVDYLTFGSTSSTSTTASSTSSSSSGSVISQSGSGTTGARPPGYVRKPDAGGKSSIITKYITGGKSTTKPISSLRTHDYRPSAAAAQGGPYQVQVRKLPGDVTYQRPPMERDYIAEIIIAIFLVVIIKLIFS